ncbi:helix-turn-helix domain-containing protein [Thermosynechococcus sp. HY213]|uniref:helix-turn-helix domain-containing protein n=1 Tax=Thermosynechococcus sp. HY213 TaxID=3074104 RepID=UPI00285ED3E2|nr:helix-turn-helix domain-containing protein [Thermosynechococcus sp. HY213]MDR7922421.1 helix-turn-helix domain-containing protein [Thermosynechococcus sp. HY213]
MPHFSNQQAKKLAEIGAFLREKRGEVGLSLEEVAAKTLVRQSILAAIENANLEELPEPVYTQGFIRRFADALGLDGKSIAANFPTVADPVERPDKPSLPRGDIGWQLRPIHLYLMYFALVAAAVAGLAYLFRPQAQSITDLAPAPTPTASPSPTPTPTAAATPTPSPTTPETVEVKLSLSDASWLEVEADGRVVYAGILASGTERSWQAKERLIVRTGNAGAVKVSVNNGPSQPMGQLGEVTEKEFLASQATSERATTSTAPERTVSN